jgi:hypothetical protein
MPDPDDHPPGRLARTLVFARWVALAVLVVLVVVRFGAPSILEPRDDIAIRPDDGDAVADIRDKLQPPTQTFTNTTARQLVAVGKSLVANPRDRQDAVRQLFTISENPELLGDDMATYLAVRSAYWQLRRDPQVRGSYEIALLLWDAAERLENDSAIAAASREADDGLK